MFAETSPASSHTRNWPARRYQNLLSTRAPSVRRFSQPNSRLVFDIPRPVTPCDLSRTGSRQPWRGYLGRASAALSIVNVDHADSRPHPVVRGCRLLPASPKSVSSTPANGSVACDISLRGFVSVWINTQAPRALALSRSQDSSGSSKPH